LSTVITSGWLLPAVSFCMQKATFGPVNETGDSPFQQVPPIGKRGLGSGSGMTDYAPLKATDCLKEANEHTLIVAQIETKEGVENIDAILGVEKSMSD
jgi:2-dehydro-3-deoxyglucarate aldolase/4-hydroxy-2-oxoheptanedioate aldolase